MPEESLLYSCRVRVWYIGKKVRWQADPTSQSNKLLRPNDYETTVSSHARDSANEVIHEITRMPIRDLMENHIGLWT
jgi:hypothetical protein